MQQGSSDAGEAGDPGCDGRVDESGFQLRMERVRRVAANDERVKLETTRCTGAAVQVLGFVILARLLDPVLPYRLSTTLYRIGDWQTRPGAEFGSEPPRCLDLNFRGSVGARGTSHGRGGEAQPMWPLVERSRRRLMPVNRPGRRGVLLDGWTLLVRVQLPMSRAPGGSAQDGRQGSAGQGNAINAGGARASPLGAWFSPGLAAVKTRTPPACRGPGRMQQMVVQMVVVLVVRVAAGDGAGGGMTTRCGDGARDEPPSSNEVFRIGQGCQRLRPCAQLLVCLPLSCHGKS